mmetsp:Transcript_59124/g.175757  ORF Transcript_59124/g.175757 Transcript_59124/m.175757 type:complete len:98 (-) Transcript_59124:34-327(-)
MPTEFVRWAGVGERGKFPPGRPEYDRGWRWSSAREGTEGVKAPKLRRPRRENEADEIEKAEEDMAMDPSKSNEGPALPWARIAIVSVATKANGQRCQ